VSTGLIKLYSLAEIEKNGEDIIVRCYKNAKVRKVTVFHDLDDAKEYAAIAADEVVNKVKQKEWWKFW
jgi:hypothetical protein